VGLTRNELGGSHYYRLFQELGANVPRVDLKVAPKTAAKLAQAMDQGLVASCHDCSEGGLAVALAEMAFAGGLGIDADLTALPRTKDCGRADAQLFSESTSRYIVEVKPENFDGFARLMLNSPFGQIGRVSDTPIVRIKTDSGNEVVKVNILTLKESWQSPLRW